MTPEQVLQYRSLIKRVITSMGMYSQEAEDLVLGTGLYESRYRYVRQIGSGIAKSFWQIEVATAQDNIRSYLKYRQSKARMCASAALVPIEYVLESISDKDVGDMLEYNMAYAIMHCRLKFYRVPHKIPTDLEGQSQYYKKYYNSSQGKAKAEEYVEQYKDSIL
jgi:hypothetical protein|tara:strand:+ start:258 stop:749 length:492 start_codon:yes stop_codon:yes gene_type:complete